MKKLEQKLDEIKSEILSELRINQDCFVDEKRRLLDACPDYIIDLAKDYHIIIAGGMITSIFCNREISDIDIYLTNKKDVFPFITELLDNSTLISVTDKSIVVNHSGVLINVVLFREFLDAVDIFNSFDFTVCMGAYDVTYECFYFNDYFFKHNSQRVLRFNDNTDFPIVSALRVSKYLKKGYSISKSEYIRILLSCVILNIDSYEKLASHIGGMYGLNIEDIIDTTKEFDIKRIISDLLSPKKNIDDSKRFVWKDSKSHELLISLLDKYKPDNVKKIDFAGQTMIVYPSGRLSTSSRFIKTDDLDVYTGDVLLYKYVEKTDNPNEFCSFYKKEFKYAIGTTIDGGSHGIHCGPLQSKSDFTYSNKQNKVLIEVRVAQDDIISSSNSYEQTRVKKVFVTRVMDENYLNSQTIKEEE